MNPKRPRRSSGGSDQSAGSDRSEGGLGDALAASSEWDARYAEAAKADSSVWSLEPNAFVAAIVADLAPGTAIDLACGEGRNALWLAQRGWQVTAVDFSRVAVETGRSRASRLGLEVEWVAADVTDWTPPALVDLIVIAYLQLPAAELASVIASCAGSLEPDGLIVLVAHDLANLERGVGGPQNPAVLTTADSLRAAAADLEVERCEQLLRRVGDATAIDTVLIARRA